MYGRKSKLANQYHKTLKLDAMRFKISQEFIKLNLTFKNIHIKNQEISLRNESNNEL